MEKGELPMARADANINKDTLSFICSQIGVTVAYLSQRTGQTEKKELNIQVKIWQSLIVLVICEQVIKAGLQKD